MRHLVLLGLLALFAATAAGEEPSKEVAAARKELAGKWRIVATEAEGEALDPTKAVVTFDGDKGVISHTGKGIPDITITITLDPTKTPRWMDVTNDQGKTQKGIYELKGDTLKAVFQGDEKGERPTAFQSKKGEVMYTYERVKPK